MEEELKKWRVDVYTYGNLTTYVDVWAKDKEDAEKKAAEQTKSPLTFKAKKAY